MLVSKGCSFVDLKASGEASRKTLVFIALKQLDNSRNHGLVCYLGKQVAGEADGGPRRIRTPDPLIRSQVLYPAELSVRYRAI